MITEPAPDKYAQTAPQHEAQLSQEHLLELMEDQLGRVAVLHQRPSYRTLVPGEQLTDYRDYITTGLFPEEDQGITRYDGGQRVDRASLVGYELPLHHTDSVQKTEALQAIRGALLLSAAATAERGTNAGSSEPKLNWADISTNLLGLADNSEHAPQRDTLLVSAVVASQFDPEQSTRINFLRTVYEQGSQQAVAAACHRSHIILIHNDNLYSQRETMVPVQRLGRAFEAEPKVVIDYLHTLESGQAAKTADQPPSISVKTAQIALNVELQNGQASPDLQSQAKFASIGGNKVNGVILDVHKIERFALQQMFIHEQMQALIGDREAEGDLAQSPLARVLAAKRQNVGSIITESDTTASLVAESPTESDLEMALHEFQSDIIQAITELSQPVIAKFTTEHTIHDTYSDLSNEQKATLRFRHIIDDMNKHKAVSQFIDIDGFVDRRQFGSMATNIRPDAEIWSSSMDGAALPDMAMGAIHQVLSAKLEAEAADKDEGVQLEISPSEVLNVLQSHRRQLIAIATHNIEGIAPPDVLGDGSVSFNRSEDGELMVDIDWPTPLKDDMDMYSAVTLGCPALRETHLSRADMSKAEKLAYGSSNYIDHMMAAIYNEAYQRGLLNVRLND